MRNRGLRMIFILLAVLVISLVAANYLFPGSVTGAGGTISATGSADPDMLLDAVFDKISVTQWSEALDWLALEEAGMLPSGMPEPDTPVWVSRGGITHFHSVPLCGGMKDPVRMTLREAVDENRVPCPVCWVIADN